MLLIKLTIFITCFQELNWKKKKKRRKTESTIENEVHLNKKPWKTYQKFNIGADFYKRSLHNERVVNESNKKSITIISSWIGNYRNRNLIVLVNYRSKIAKKKGYKFKELSIECNLTNK